MSMPAVFPILNPTSWCATGWCSASWKRMPRTLKSMPTNPLTHHIDVQYVVPAEGLPGEDDFEAWSRVALAGRRDGAELCVRIVSREESGQLNRRYRHKTGATNVLSFPADLPDYVEDPYLGDLVICAEVVAE